MKIFSAVAIAALTFLGLVVGTQAPAGAAASWQLLQCKSVTGYPNVQMCFYRDANAAGHAQGRLINNYTKGIKNRGFFQRSDESQIDCGLVTTPAGSTSTCTRTLTSGSWRLGDQDYLGSNYYYNLTDFFAF